MLRNTWRGRYGTPLVIRNYPVTFYHDKNQHTLGHFPEEWREVRPGFKKEGKEG